MFWLYSQIPSKCRSLEPVNSHINSALWSHIGLRIKHLRAKRFLLKIFLQNYTMNFKQFDHLAQYPWLFQSFEIGHCFQFLFLLIDSNARSGPWLPWASIAMSRHYFFAVRLQCKLQIARIRKFFSPGFETSLPLS